MIKLYREEVSAVADIIEAEFQDITLGYDRVVLNSKDAIEKFGPEHPLTLITNNERIVSGDSIPAYIKELQTLIEDWRAFQGDSCYVNDKGETC